MKLAWCVFISARNKYSTSSINTFRRWQALTTIYHSTTSYQHSDHQALLYTCHSNNSHSMASYKNPYHQPLFSTGPNKNWSLRDKLPASVPPATVVLQALTTICHSMTRYQHSLHVPMLSTCPNNTRLLRDRIPALGYSATVVYRP